MAVTLPKKTVKLKDLAQLSRPVDISDTEQILVRALNLQEMVQLFIDSREDFLQLYSAGLEGVGPEVLAPFLLSSPKLVATILALASDEPESAAIIQQRMPATVQLIALYEVWKASVPDPKKARELLSEVTALLRKLNSKSAGAVPGTPTTSSPTTLPLG
jgi:hypothetical protein